MNLRAMALGLALVACLAIFVLIGPASWPLVLAWAGATALTAVAWPHLPGPVQLAVAILFVPLCVVLTFEGGGFFLPSAIALVGDALDDRHRVAA